MMVTEGGGAGSFGAAGGFGMAGGAAFCCCGGCGALGSACGEPASFCAQEAPTADVAKATAIKMNWRLARIRPPELLDPKPSLAHPPVSGPVRSKPGFGRGYARPPTRPRRHGGVPQGRRLKGQVADRARPPR